ARDNRRSGKSALDGQGAASATAHDLARGHGRARAIRGDAAGCGCERATVGSVATDASGVDSEADTLRMFNFSNGKAQTVFPQGGTGPQMPNWQGLMQGWPGAGMLQGGQNAYGPMLQRLMQGWPGFQQFQQFNQAHPGMFNQVPMFGQPGMDAGGAVPMPG